MARYITRAPKPKSFDDGWYEPPLMTDVTVVECDPLPTGLLDAEGNEIWRLSDPIGFVWYE